MSLEIINSVLIIDTLQQVSLSPPLLLSLCFQKRGAQSVCHCSQEVSFPLINLTYPSLSSVIAKVFITSESCVALFLFYVGFCVPSSADSPPSLKLSQSVFPKAYSWSRYTAKLKLEYFSHSENQVPQITSTQDLILEMSALVSCFHRFTSYEVLRTLFKHFHGRGLVLPWG